MVWRSPGDATQCPAPAFGLPWLALLAELLTGLTCTKDRTLTGLNSNPRRMMARRATLQENCTIFNQKQCISLFQLLISAILSPVSPVPSTDWGHGKPLFMRCPQCPHCPHAKKRERKQNTQINPVSFPRLERQRLPSAWSWTARPDARS